MKAVFKSLSVVAMVFTVTMSGAAMADTTASAIPAAAATAVGKAPEAAATQPTAAVVHHHKHVVKDAAKPADSTAPVTVDKAAANVPAGAAAVNTLAVGKSSEAVKTK